MSIVVAVRKKGRVVVAADTLTSRGNERMPESNTSMLKFTRVGKALIGGAGWTIYDTVLRDWIARGPAPKLTNEGEIHRFFIKFWRALKDRYSYVNDQAVEKERPFADLDAEFLVASKDGIFEVAPDMGVTRCEQYVAIGSGAPYALGAMRVIYEQEQDAERIARTAVSTAMEFDVHCGGKVVAAVV